MVPSGLRGQGKSLHAGGEDRTRIISHLDIHSHCVVVKVFGQSWWGWEAAIYHAFSLLTWEMFSQKSNCALIPTLLKVASQRLRAEVPWILEETGQDPQFFPSVSANSLTHAKTPLVIIFLLKYCYTQWNAAAVLVQGGITKQPCLHFKYLW